MKKYIKKHTIVDVVSLIVSLFFLQGHDENFVFNGGIDRNRNRRESKTSTLSLIMGVGRLKAKTIKTGSGIHTITVYFFNMGLWFKHPSTITDIRNRSVRTKWSRTFYRARTDDDDDDKCSPCVTQR